MQTTAKLREDITFKNVGFKYNGQADLFTNLNLTGASGSGKSTLMSLLQHKHPLQKGSLSIGDHNVNSINAKRLKNLVGVVAQDIDIITGNVMHNIAVNELKPNLSKIKRICKSIGVLEFIENLEYGFETYLGANGAFLSGGQKQGIAIARALYNEPEILVLDEATSCLDSKSESYIQQAIVDLKRKGKTIIIISHRLSNIVYADKIVVLDKGKVVEEGTHDSLYNINSQYYDLWQYQLPILEF